MSICNDRYSARPPNSTVVHARSELTSMCRSLYDDELFKTPDEFCSGALSPGIFLLFLKLMSIYLVLPT